MTDFSKLPLGAIPSPPKAKDLLLSKYVGDAGRLIEAARVPVASNWQDMPTVTGALPTPDTDPLGNIAKKDCVFAAAGHLTRMVAQQVGRPELAPTADQVLEEYDRRTGGVDQGYVIRDMLDIWRTEGLWGTRLEAFARVGDSRDELAIASWLGCGVIGGYALPLHSQTSVDATGRQLWHVPAGGWPEGDYPGAWGNHAVWSYSESPQIKTGNSWGGPVWLTDEWGRVCCFERWFCLVDLWRLGNVRAPNGFAWEDLLSDARERVA
jgi:hypothetical protein